MTQRERKIKMHVLDDDCFKPGMTVAEWMASKCARRYRPPLTATEVYIRLCACELAFGNGQQAL